MLTPQQFRDLNNELSTLTTEQANITGAVRKEWAHDSLPNKETLTGIKNRLLEGDLRVLVMGRFSSGKSTFLNAMMGKALLPAKAIPTTAVIGEIKYADAPSATLFPKKGALKTGDKPFNVPIEDIGKYIVINHEDDSDNDSISPFEKIIIKYPLHICKMGIEFVDSPGLDDPTCHDAITKDYLPSADAILYCMNSQNAFSAFDKMQIEHLRAIGYKSIIFVLTYFDMLETNDSLTGRHEAEETKKHYTDKLLPYTDLGADGIFFVGSLPALMGKLRNDNNLLQESHFPPLEKKLEQVLFNERGRIKLAKAIQGVKRVNKDTARFLQDALEIGKQDKSKLAANLAEANANLNKAMQKANLISSSFTSGTKQIIDGAKTRARQFMLNEVIPNIDSWITSFRPTKEQTISIWHPKKSGRVFTEACMQHFQAKLEMALSQWCSDELIPNYLMPKIQELSRQQNKNLEAFEQDLKNIRGSLSIPLTAEAHEVSGSNRIFSAIAGVLLLNPAAAIAGGSLGWDGLLPTLITTIVANIVLYIIAFFTGPIGWTAIIITNIMVLLVGGDIIGSGKIEEKTKKKIAAVVKSEMSKHQEEFVQSIGDSINDIISKIDAAVIEEINKPVKQFEALLNQAKNDINAKGSNLDNKLASMKTLLKENDKIADKLDDYAQSIMI